MVVSKTTLKNIQNKNFAEDFQKTIVFIFFEKNAINLKKTFSWQKTFLKFF
jgi:hypothetical protein